MAVFNPVGDAGGGIARKLLCSCFIGLLLIVGMASASSAQALTTKWTNRTVPPPEGATEVKPVAVSCTAPDACTAVGSFKGHFTERGLLAERWNGEKWTVQTVPTAVTIEESGLTGVSCTTATLCTAVGYQKVSGKLQTLSFRWNGASWTALTVNLPEKTEEERLTSVACPATNFCIAGGYYKTGGVKLPVAAITNGSTPWTTTVLPTPEKTEEGSIAGVSCLSTLSCTLVGNYKTGGVVKPLGERWATTKYELTTPVFPKEAVEGRLEAVSCVPAAGTCTAGGSYKPTASVKLALTETWTSSTSTWIQVPFTATGGAKAEVLGISCTEASFCLATGTYTNASSAVRPLAERWSGSGWVPEQPNFAEGVWTEQTLPGVSCASNVRCMTAGYYGSSGSWTPNAQTYSRLNAPANTVLPAITPAEPKTGVEETATNGTWTEEPTSFAYQWLRCNGSGLECVKIAGATKATYAPLAGDVGSILKIEVTATNVAGSTTATANATGKIALGKVVEYALPAGSTPRTIAAGPDGNLWFTNCGTNSIGKITTAGAVTEYSVSVPESSCPYGIAKGPDGKMWFTVRSGKYVGKITTAGVVTTYTLSQPMKLMGPIVKGPDGNMWFTASEEGAVGKITTSGVFTAYPLTGWPGAIAAGPDGNLWVVGHNNRTINKMSTSGVVLASYQPKWATFDTQIVSGPEEKLWWGQGSGSGMGKISTAGAITEYELPTEFWSVQGVTEGPEGLIWFAHGGANKVGRITAGGTATEWSVPAGSNPFWIAPGPDGNLWFTEPESNRIGVITP